MPKLGSRSRFGVLAAGLVATLTLSACNSGAPSTVSPKGPGAVRIAGLWWFMFAISAFVIVLVGVLLLFGIRPRRGPASDPETVPRWARSLVLVGGLVFPVIVLTVLWLLTLHDMSALSSPSRPTALTVDVVGHRWWWEVRYPEQGIVTANDIHVPVGQPVRIVLTTDDVIHSFWVPQLTSKTDLISGRVNSMWLQADHPGVYRGQCAEYCGLQHANMIFYVIAQPPTQYQQWAAEERTPPPTPTDPTLLQGEQAFLNSACVACHTLQGTPADGKAGPDLSHFGGRLTIGAGAAPNTPGNLGGWIIDSQALKPGNLMPPIQLDAKDLQALILYLESLK